MSVIDVIIPSQSFEIIRNRIGEILADEIANQFDLTDDEDLDASQWIERFVTYDLSELPAINVMMAEGTYSGQTVIQQDGTYRFYIDVYVQAKSGPDDPGDQKAMVKLQRLLGVCRAILEDPKYKTLGYPVPSGFIMNKHIDSIQIQNPNQKEHDALNTAMGRIILSVKAPEVPGGFAPIYLIKEFLTSVRLMETDKGYLWIDYYS
jgi:hypothetical protein